MKEEIIGAVVVAAVIVAGVTGVYLVLSKPAGRAFSTGVEVTECVCKMNGDWDVVLYSDRYVLTPDEQMRHVGVIDAEEKCPVVCASIGGHY